MEQKIAARTSGRRKIAYLMAAVCVAGSLAGCGQTTEEVIVSDAANVQVQLPEQGSLVLQNEFIGTVSPEEAVYVVPLVSAEVLNTTVEVGDTVNAGDVLCRLDSEAAELQLASAQASYETAQASANSTLGGQMELQDVQTANSINQLERQINDMNEDLTDSKNDYEDASNDLDNVSEWKHDAKENFEDASEEYYTAEALYNKFKDLQSSAGGKMFSGMSLSEAASAATGYVKDYKTKEGMYEAAKKALEEYEESHGEEEAAEISEEDGSTDGDDAEGEGAEGEDGGAEQEMAELSSSEYDSLKAAYEAAEADFKALDHAEYNAAITAIGLHEACKSEGLSSEDISQTGLSKLSSKMASAQSEYTNASTQKSTLEAKKDGYDNAVDQLEGSLGTLEDNLKAAKDIDTVTQDRVKAETQAVMDAQLNAAGIGIQSAEMQLDMYTLTSPISGVVESVNVTEHGFASSGNAAFVISNKDTMTVTFTVSEAIRGTLSVGQNISVDRNGNVYNATITEIGTMVDANTGLFKIKASVDADGSQLLTGSSVKVIADTYRENDTLLLPYDAVYYENGQAYVYTADNGAARRKNVETGIFNESKIAILSGISAEDKVITTWASNLRDGVAVEIEEPEEAE